MLLRNWIPMRRLPIWTGATAVICCGAAGAKAQESAFHEVETKYIFGSFTVGSSIDAEGEKAFEPETQSRFRQARRTLRCD